MLHLNGILYQDFMLFENLLYIAHGRFITIVDINDVKNKKSQYHLQLNMSMNLKPVKFGHVRENN